jgi:hypothetical protein
VSWWEVSVASWGLILAWITPHKLEEIKVRGGSVRGRPSAVLFLPLLKLMLRSRQLGTMKKTSSDWENTYWTVIQLWIPSRELGPLSRAVNEAELTISLPDKAPLIVRCSSSKVLGQLYVCLNSLWALFVTVTVQFMYCLVLCLCWPATKTNWGSLPLQELHANNHHWLLDRSISNFLLKMARHLSRHGERKQTGKKWVVSTPATWIKQPFTMLPTWTGYLSVLTSLK